MKVAIELTPEAEELVRTCVASGRYENAEAVIATALRVFAAVEVERAEFERSIIEASEEADRAGTFTIEEVMEEVEAIIAEAERERAA
jgi:putative addiction module CopG family antidote